MQTIKAAPIYNPTGGDIWLASNHSYSGLLTEVLTHFMARHMNGTRAAFISFQDDLSFWSYTVVDFNIIYENTCVFHNAGFRKSFHLQIVLIIFSVLFSGLKFI